MGSNSLQQEVAAVYSPTTNLGLHAILPLRRGRCCQEQWRSYPARYLPAHGCDPWCAELKAAGGVGAPQGCVVSWSVAGVASFHSWVPETTDNFLENFLENSARGRCFPLSRLVRFSTSCYVQVVHLDRRS